jgi:hypothetical protein
MFCHYAPHPHSDSEEDPRIFFSRNKCCGGKKKTDWLIQPHQDIENSLYPQQDMQEAIITHSTKRGLLTGTEPDQRVRNRVVMFTHFIN